MALERWQDHALSGAQLARVVRCPAAPSITRPRRRITRPTRPAPESIITQVQMPGLAADRASLLSGAATGAAEADATASLGAFAPSCDAAEAAAPGSRWRGVAAEAAMLEPTRPATRTSSKRLARGIVCPTHVIVLRIMLVPLLVMVSATSIEMPRASTAALELYPPIVTT
jgi:hypothetical protein